MKYYLFNTNDYIIGIGIGLFGNNEISQIEYEKILKQIKQKPKAPEGYEYKLKTDLTWELIELPSQPEPNEDEATEIDYKNALFDLRVEIND